MSQDTRNSGSPLSKVLGKLERRARRSLGWFRSPESVFTEIYRKNQWGGEAGEPCSGGGSAEALIADPYVDLLERHAERFGFKGMDFVDLGCGDMRIGSRLIPLCRNYVGVDVVRYLVERLRDEFGSERVSFAHLDIVDEDLPAGDVCFLRQVLQHLSNRQIRRILPKLRKYKRVYVTEHIPVAERFLTVNLDKPPGGGIRLDRGSGVDLCAPPFNLPATAFEVVLETPGDPGGASEAGVIRTVLYQPQRG